MSIKTDIIEYWDRQPCNIKHGKSPIGTYDYFNEVKIRRYTVEPHILEFMQIDKCTEKRILEVGCGIGTDSIIYALHGANVYAIDISEQSLKIAKASAIAVLGYTQNKIEFHKWDIENPIKIDKDKKFHIVYSLGVLHHTPNIELALNNIAQVITQGGEFRILLYAKWSWKNLLIKLGVAQSEAQSNCPLSKTFSKREVRKMLRLVGFDIESIKKTHIFCYSIPEYKKGKLVKTRFWSLIPLFLLNGFKKLFGQHLLIVAKYKGTKK